MSITKREKVKDINNQMIHVLSALNPREFEICREIASQRLGFPPHQYWPRMTTFDPAASMEHLQDLKNADTADDYSNRIKQEQMKGGSVYAETFKHVLHNTDWKTGSGAVSAVLNGLTYLPLIGDKVEDTPILRALRVGSSINATKGDLNAVKGTVNNAQRYGKLVSETRPWVTLK